MKLFLILFFLTLQLFATQTLFDKIEKLNIGVGEYKLGKMISENQKTSAKKSPLETNSIKTYKFQDGDLFVTVDKKSNRVIVLYKIFEDQNSTQLKRVLGGTIGAYGEPTTLTHGNIVYWIYKEDGLLITNDDYMIWKDLQLNDKAKNSKLNKLYTIKLSSTKMFESKDKFDDAKAYLIISSEKLLKEIIKD